MIKNKIYKSDWLASDPIFYNEKSLEISHNINDVIDYANINFHPEGLANYLSWGYSVFGQTPIENVKFLLPNQILIKSKSKHLIIKNIEDPIEDWSHKPSKAKNVIELIESKVDNWGSNLKNPLVLPLSGGYDSRLLGSMIKNKLNSYSYTFGPTRKQNDSFEVKYAEATAIKLGLNWEHIKLGNYHKYLDDWNDLYGVSTHAHGMYQLDFYNQIKRKHKNASILSGIIGDAWSGKVIINRIQSIADLSHLGYSHGVHADSESSLLGNPMDLKIAYLSDQKEKFRVPGGQVIASMRMKMILLSYLFKVPESLGFSFYGPFLESDIACAMLNLPQVERENRLWQTRYFCEQDLLWEKNYKYPVKRVNTINQDLINEHPLRPLNVKILSQIINPNYVSWINNNLMQNIVSKIATFSLNTRYLGYFANQLHVPNVQLNAYFAYLTLKPLEVLLLKREGI